MNVIPSKYITLDPVAKTITLTGPYAALELPMLIKVYNMTTNDMLYDMDMKDTTATMSSNVITYTCNNPNIAADDVIRITIISSLEVAIGVNTTTNSNLVTEQSPIDQHVLDEKLLDAVTTAQSSTAIYTLDKKSLTLGVSVSSLTSGATIKVEASNTGDTGDWGAIGTVDNVGNVEKERVFGTGDLTENGAYFFEIVNAQRVKYMRVTLENVIDGTYTVYLTGGAI